MATATTPYGNPNWFKRQSNMAERKAQRNQPKAIDFRDARQVATLAFNNGYQADSQGAFRPMRDIKRDATAASQQMNSLSLGAKAGSASNLGRPANTSLPIRGGGSNDFGGLLAQRNQQMMSGNRADNIAQAKASGSFGSIRDTFNQQGAAYGQMMDNKGDIVMGPKTTTPQALQEKQQAANRGFLQEQADSKWMLRQMSGEEPTINVTKGVLSGTPAKAAISGKYGSGSSTFSFPGDKLKPGKIGVTSPSGETVLRPAKEVMQGLANKPGIARPGDKYQPQKWTAEDLRKISQAKKR